MITLKNCIQTVIGLYTDMSDHMVEKDLAAAEDVTQEVFLVAYQKWQEVRRHPNQKGFCC